MMLMQNWKIGHQHRDGFRTSYIGYIVGAFLLFITSLVAGMDWADPKRDVYMAHWLWFAISFSILGVSALLHVTSQDYRMDKASCELWNKYRSLDKDTRNAVGLTPKKILKLSSIDDSRILRTEVSELVEAQKRRKTEEAKVTGPMKQAIDQIRLAKVREQEIAQSHIEVRQELTARGWE